MQQLLMDSQAVFADVLRSVELSHSQVLELLQTHQRSASSRVEAHTYSLQQEIISLNQKQEELRRLDSIQDPITFLNVSDASALIMAGVYHQSLQTGGCV